MPGKKQGSKGSKPDGGKADSDAKKAGPAKPPLDGKIDEIVAKVVPDHLLPTVAAAVAVAAVLFFLLTIIGFARSPGAAAEAEIEGREEDLMQLRGRLADTEKTMKEAVEARKKAGTEARAAARQVEAGEKKAEGLQARLDAALETKKKLNAEISGLKREARSADAREGKAKRLAETAKVQLERARASAEKGSGAFGEKIEKLQARLAEEEARYKELARASEERDKSEENAREVFENIIAAASKIEDPAARIEEIVRLREESESDLLGTSGMVLLDKEIARQEKLAVKKKRKAVKLAAQEAKKAYDEVKRRLAVADDPDGRMAILTEAKEDLAGTDYEPRVDRQIARGVYDGVLAEIRSNPESRDANLQAIRDALPRTQGTRYGKALKRLLDAWEKRPPAESE